MNEVIVVRDPVVTQVTVQDGGSLVVSENVIPGPPGALPDLPDAGGGALLKIARDAKGRLTGTSPVSAADLRDASLLTLLAAGDVSAMRVIVAESGSGRHADPSNPDDARKVVGVSVSAAADGDPVAVLRWGEWEEPLWAWVSGPLFCGAEGVLTQTPPAAGWVLEVGRAMSSTRVLFDLKLPIKRA